MPSDGVAPQDQCPPTLLTLSYLLRPVLDGPESTNHKRFSFVASKEPHENALLPQGKLARGPTQLCSPCVPCTLAPRGHTPAALLLPHFKGGKTVALKAQCWSQDRKAHLCLGAKLLTPQLRALPDPCSEPQCCCSFGLRCAHPPGQPWGSVSRAGVNLLAAVGPNTLLHLEPPGEQMQWVCPLRAALCFTVPSSHIGFGLVTTSEAQVPPSARPSQGDPKPVSSTQPAWPHATPLPLPAVLLGALPPPPENHLRCYLVLFALLKLLMVFCNRKKTGDLKVPG